MEDRNTHPADAAYPMNFEYPGEVDGIPSVNTKTSFGLTKREYFAALAMHGLISSSPSQVHNSYQGCQLACEWADSLITQLNKQP